MKIFNMYLHVREMISIIGRRVFCLQGDYHLNLFFNGRIKVKQGIGKYFLPTRAKALREYQKRLNCLEHDRYVIVPDKNFSFKSKSYFLTTSFSDERNELRENFSMAGEILADYFNYQKIYIPMFLLNELVIPGVEVYVPHLSKHELSIKGDKTSIITYMQMVFPNFFTVSRSGWGPYYVTDDTSYIASQVLPKPSFESFVAKVKDTRLTKIPSRLKQKIEFEQDYDIVFFGQLPHDKIITETDALSPYEALRRLISVCKKLNLRLGMKAHPLHKSHVNYYNDLYNQLDVLDENLHPHDIFAKTKVVATVNSGIGMEALLCQKKVVAFGSSDYSHLCFNAYPLALDEICESLPRWIIENTDLDETSAWLEYYFIENNLLLGFD